jgi:hypothetical protein
LPPIETDDQTGTSSTADTANQSQPAPQPGNDGSSASSATPTGENKAPPANEQEQKPASALDAAKAAIAADDAKKASATPDTGEATAAKPDGDATDGEKEPTDEELEQGIEKLSAGAQKRIKTLSRRLKDANTRLAEVEGELKPRADLWDRLSNYTRSNNLEGSEVQQGLQIMALMKNNPVKALEMLQPHLDMLNAFVGNILPADLKQQVDAGELTEAHARTIVATRNEARRTADAAQRDREVQEQRNEQQAANEIARDMTAALNTYEGELRAANPDYDRMKPFYYDKVRAALLSEKPRTAADARQVAKTAWDQTREAFKGLGVQPKPATDPVRQPGGRSTPANQEPPKSAIEAARRAVGDA